MVKSIQRTVMGKKEFSRLRETLDDASASKRREILKKIDPDEMGPEGREEGIDHGDS